MSWTIERLMDLATAYWHSAVLSAAVELDLFAALEGAGKTAAEVARLLKASQRHTEELLCALTALGLVCQQDGRFSMNPDVVHLLSRSSSTCILDALEFNIDLYPLWGKLAKSVQSGAPVLSPSAHLGQSADRTRRFVLGMHSRARVMAPAILPAINLEGCHTLLDLAAGPGTFSCLLAERYSFLRITLFDLPPILEIAKEVMSPSSVMNRMVFQPGNYHTDPLPGPFDAVLFSGAIHQENSDNVLNIMARIRQVLRPGGRLWLVDMMLETGRIEPLFSALFSLNMMLTSPGGRVYEGVELTQMLTQTGFVEPVCYRPSASPYWIISATNPIS